MFAHVSVCLCIVSLSILPATPAHSQSHNWTTTTDFSLGVLHHTEPLSGQLRIDQTPGGSILPYLWVPCTQRNTVVRIATSTADPMTCRSGVQVGQILGEYYSAPSNCRASPDFQTAVWRYRLS